MTLLPSEVTASGFYYFLDDLHWRLQKDGLSIIVVFPHNIPTQINQIIFGATSASTCIVLHRASDSGVFVVCIIYIGRIT